MAAPPLALLTPPPRVSPSPRVGAGQAAVPGRAFTAVTSRPPGENRFLEGRSGGQTRLGADASGRTRGSSRGLGDGRPPASRGGSTPGPRGRFKRRADCRRQSTAYLGDQPPEPHEPTGRGGRRAGARELRESGGGSAGTRRRACPELRPLHAGSRSAAGLPPAVSPQRPRRRSLRLASCGARSSCRGKCG